MVELPAPKATKVADIFTREALACAERAGLSPQGLLTELGLPDRGLDIAQFAALWRGISARMGCELFGLGARPMPQGSFAMLGHVMRLEPDLERAIRRGLALLGLLLGTPSGRLEIRAGRAVITLSDPAPLQPDPTQAGQIHRAQDAHTAFAHRTFWIVLHGLSCWLVRRRIPLLTVDFACAEPSESAAYGQFFGAPTGFDQPVSALSFDARHLRLPITRSAADLRGFLRGAPANILTGYSHDAQLVGQVTALLRARDPMDWPDFPALAAEIGLPETSLRRALKQQGASYRELKDQIRQAQAVALLRAGKEGAGQAGAGMSVAQIASALGYAEPSAFYRAFRKWRGMTPEAFRHRA
jgi:AraC-like DNA-binding protein